jgi:hypothetical protein
LENTIGACGIKNIGEKIMKKYSYVLESNVYDNIRGWLKRKDIISGYRLYVGEACQWVIEFENKSDSVLFEIAWL